MSLGIYKPGQGYWTRVMTACLVGVATLATAAFLWKQGEVLVERVLPKSQAALILRLETGQPVVGQTLELLADGERPGQTVKIGTGQVLRYAPEQQSVVLHNLAMEPERTAIDARRIQGEAPAAGAGGAGVVALSGLVDRATLQPPVEPLYVQGGLAAVVILVGAVIGYWLTAVRRGTVDFLVATDFEMKKVNWSTRREIIGSTWVVIGAGVVIATSLFVFDLAFQGFFKAIGVIAG
jgi:preprotein translocase SecE subunit